jgi:phage anti-repressor protein
MNDIVRIQEIEIGGQQEQGVNARELHRKLENGYRFSEWIERRITEAMLKEGKDFVSFSEISEKPSGGRPSIEYHLTLDSAKHIAMLERSEIGYKVRQYFIEFEKRTRAAIDAAAAISAVNRYLIAKDWKTSRDAAGLRDDISRIASRTANAMRQKESELEMAYATIETLQTNMQQEISLRKSLEQEGKQLVLENLAWQSRRTAPKREEFDMAQNHAMIANATHHFLDMLAAIVKKWIDQEHK